MRCSRCGADLVEVDNPFRKEFRHRRGVECAASEAALEVPEPHIMAADSSTRINGPTCGAVYNATTPPCSVDADWPHDEHSNGEWHWRTPEVGKEVSTWADAAMFRSEPMPVNERGRVEPTAYLLNAMPDPLGSLAALAAIYTGGVRRRLADVTDAERHEALQEVFKNKLQGPLEVIQFHFLLEGVSRSFTHQLVRGRRAFYAQESLRFAVVEGDPWTNRVALPPSIAGTKDDRYHEPLGAESSVMEYQRNVWDEMVAHAEQAYLHLVDSGMPAEDARGLMPHAMTTRVHWVVTLRELLYVAGVRLCTQAQFEWRTAMASVVKSIRNACWTPEGPVTSLVGRANAAQYDWQYKAIADLLRPICYQEGKCGFKAKADRSCSIRERVDAFEREGVGSQHWGTMQKDMPANNPEVPVEVQLGRQWRIDPSEWLADPKAAR